MNPNKNSNLHEPTTLIDKVQTQLECLYGIGVPHRVDDYLIDKQEAITYLNTPDKLPKELLLVRQPEEDTVEVALFLDQNLMQNLKHNCPFTQLDHKNLSDFCILIEGVSHFVYFLWKAYQQHPITQLEMELQAEIDKFLMLFLFLKSDHEPEYAKQLLKTLFDDFNLLEGLNAEQRGRYLTASSLAARFCFKLQEKFCRNNDIQSLIDEIRRFYSFSQEQKITHINN